MKLAEWRPDQMPLVSLCWRLCSAALDTWEEEEAVGALIRPREAGGL